MHAVSGDQLQTYSRDLRVPIYRITYYDSPYGVPSLGYKSIYYDDTTGLSSFDFSSDVAAFAGNDNILSYDYGQVGAPPGVSQSSFWKVKHMGYFYAEFTGDYTFYVSKNPNDYFAFYFDNTQVHVTGFADVSDQYKIKEWETDYEGAETRSVTISLTEGDWYRWELWFAARSKNTYLSCRYLEPENATSADGETSDNDGGSNVYKKIMSAGITNYRDAWATGADYTPVAFESGYELQFVSSINGGQDVNKSNLYAFNVPLVTDTPSVSGKGGGFLYDDSNGLYYNDQLDIHLRQGRLVYIDLGYQSKCLYATGSCGFPDANITGFYIPACDLYGNNKCPGNAPPAYDYIRRFTGSIVEIGVDRGQDSEIKIECQDNMGLVVEQINENFPDTISYVNADFTTDTALNQPNGLTRPRTYDAWPLQDAVRDIYVKAGIDPTLLYGKETVLGKDGSIKTAGYIIDDKDIRLKRRNRYGNPLVTEAELVDEDDPYIWQFNFGDSLIDMVNKMSDTYGFIYGTSPQGETYFRGVDAPSTTIADETNWPDSAPEWVTRYHLGVDGGLYLEGIGDDVSLTITGLSGSAFGLNFVQTYSTAIVQSGWDIVYQEWPYQEEQYDPSKRPDFPFGTLYSKAVHITFDNGIPSFSYTLHGGIYYFRPTGMDSAFVLSGLKIRTEKDFPWLLQSHPDDNLVADISIGEVTASWTTLTNETVVKAGWQRPLQQRFTVDFDTIPSFSIENDKIYGVKFMPRMTDTPTILPSIYTVECSWRRPGDGSIGSYMSTSGYNDGTISWQEDAPEKRVYPRIEIVGSGALVGGSPDRSISTVVVYTGGVVVANEIYRTEWDNTYSGPNIKSELLRYPNDGADFTGVNPNILYIGAQELGTLQSGGHMASYSDDYIITITQNTDYGPDFARTRMSSIDSYDYDFSDPVWVFSTDKDIEKLTTNQGIDDVRNDVVVVGDRIGAFKDLITQEVVNKNNPTFQHVYSRSVDVSSIHNPDSTYNIGRRKPFIIFEPAITNQRHADWMSLAILQRYNRAHNVPKYNTIGLAMLEANDPVGIVDKFGGSLGLDNLQWITDLKESYGVGTYELQLNTTPFKPYGSFTPRVNPNIDNFGGHPFINVVLSDSQNLIRSGLDFEGEGSGNPFDIYEVEESGNTLKIKYDQVVDGDVLVKVMTSTLHDGVYERPVAYLVGSIDEGVEKPEFREWGQDYVLLWDGIDQTGFSKTNFVSTGTTQQLTEMGFHEDFRQPGLYAMSGDYFIRFQLFPRDENVPPITLDTNKHLTAEYNVNAFERITSRDAELYPDEVFPQTFYIVWGDVLVPTMHVSGFRSGDAERSILNRQDFYDDEFGGQGAKFVFSFDQDKRRYVNFNVDLHHIWSAGVRANVDTDGESKYRLISQTYMKLQRGLADEGNFDAEVAVHDSSFPVALSEGLKDGTLSMDYDFVRKGTGLTRYIYLWNVGMPHTFYNVENYVGPGIFKISDTENKLSFFVNPSLSRAGGWPEDGLPDMSSEHFKRFKGSFAPLAYYAVDDTNLEIIVSHCFQAVTTMWDNTGRLMRSEDQSIGTRKFTVLATDYHNHDIGYDNGVGGQPIVSGDLGPPLINKHMHLNDTYVMRASEWSYPTWRFSDTWNNGDGKDIELSERMYDMTRPGDSTNSWGVGSQLITGWSLYGRFLWHGWWFGGETLAIPDSGIPLNYEHIPETRMWKYWELDVDSNDLKAVVMPLWKMVLGTYFEGGSMPDWDDFSHQHAHIPFHETRKYEGDLKYVKRFWDVVDVTNSPEDYEFGQDTDAHFAAHDPPYEELGDGTASNKWRISNIALPFGGNSSSQWQTYMPSGSLWNTIPYGGYDVYINSDQE